MTNDITTIPVQKFQDDDSQRPNGPIWMPMYWADYLSHTQHLSPVENGAYLLLIAAYWIRRGPLPDNRKFLCRITRTHPHTWTKIEMNVLSFFERDCGYLKHKRLEKELLKSCDRIASAKRAASARWSSALPTTITITKEERKKDSTSSPNGNDAEFETFWSAYPRRVGKAAAKKSFAKAVKSGVPAQQKYSRPSRVKKKLARPQVYPPPGYVAQPRPLG